MTTDPKHTSKMLALVNSTYEDVSRCIERFDNGHADVDAAVALVETAKKAHGDAVLSMGSRRAKRDGPRDPRVTPILPAVLHQLVPRRTYAVSVGFSAAVLSAGVYSDPVSSTVWAAIAHRLTHPATTDPVTITGTELQQGSLAASILAARVVQLDHATQPPHAAAVFGGHVFFELAEYKKGEALALSIPIAKALALAGPNPLAADVAVHDCAHEAPAEKRPAEIAVHATSAADAGRAIEYLGDIVTRDPQKTWSQHLEAALLTAMHAFRAGCSPDICTLVHELKRYAPIAAYLVVAETNAVLSPFEAPGVFSGQLESHLEARVSAALLEAARNRLERKTSVLEHLAARARKSASKPETGSETTVDDVSEAERKKRAPKKKRPAKQAPVISSDEESEGEEDPKRAKEAPVVDDDGDDEDEPWEDDDIVAGDDDDDDDDDDDGEETAVLAALV